MIDKLKAIVGVNFKAVVQSREFEVEKLVLDCGELTVTVNSLTLLRHVSASASEATGKSHSL